MKKNNLDIMKYLSVASVPFLPVLLVMFVTGCNEEIAPTAAVNESSNKNSLILPKKILVHHVSLGGADICEVFGLPTGCDANFSLVANMYDDGSVSGQWQDTFGGGGGTGIHVVVDCINIVGNGAVIGGVITHGTNASGIDVSGQYAITAVVDNGTSVNDPPDQISISIIDPPLNSCHDITPDDFAAFGILFDLSHGQVTVW